MTFEKCKLFDVILGLKHLHWLSIRFKIQSKSLLWPLIFYVIWPHPLLYSTSLNLPQTPCFLWCFLSVSICANIKVFVLDVSFAWNHSPWDFLMDYFLCSFRCQLKCSLFKMQSLTTSSKISKEIHTSMQNALSHSSLLLYFST